MLVANFNYLTKQKQLQQICKLRLLSVQDIYLKSYKVRTLRRSSTLPTCFMWARGCWVAAVLPSAVAAASLRPLAVGKTWAARLEGHWVQTLCQYQHTVIFLHSHFIRFAKNSLNYSWVYSLPPHRLPLFSPNCRTAVNYPPRARGGEHKEVWPSCRFTSKRLPIPLFCIRRTLERPHRVNSQAAAAPRSGSGRRAEL